MRTRRGLQHLGEMRKDILDGRFIQTLLERIVETRHDLHRPVESRIAAASVAADGAKIAGILKSRNELDEVGRELRLGLRSDFRRQTEE